MSRLPEPAAAYVYALHDPRDGAIFYIGKGIGGRMYQHAQTCRRATAANAEKNARLRAILDAGLSVEYEILAEGLSDEAALALERSFLFQYAGTLTNVAPGSPSPDQRQSRERDLRQAVRTDLRALIAECYAVAAALPHLPIAQDHIGYAIGCELLLKEMEAEDA